MKADSGLTPETSNKWVMRKIPLGDWHQVVVGFNTEDPCNKEILKILCNYSCMMTGQIPVYAEDEFDMVIEAIKHSM